MFMHAPIKVMDVELSRPIETLTGLEAYPRVKLLVRLHGTPIGYIILLTENGTCPRGMIVNAVFDQHGSTIVRHVARQGLMNPVPGEGLSLHALLNLTGPQLSLPHAPPLVTVAVCTRDRTDNLALCLDSLTRLNYLRLDVLVIDNAPSTESTCALMVDRFPQFRYVCESRPGLDWARNRAIAESAGEIIAFADDDVIVDIEWVAALARAFTEDESIMAVTGLVVPFELETDAQILFEDYGGFGKGFERTWFQTDRRVDRNIAMMHGWAGKFGTGANMAFRLKLFEQIGPFDPALDVGTVTNGGGDIEMFFRVLKEGHTLLYEPAAIVRHRHRRDYASLRRQIVNNGIGFTSYMVRSSLHHPKERLAFLRLAWIWLRTWHWHRVIASFRGKNFFPRDLILGEFRGGFIGLPRYFQARRTAAQLRQMGKTSSVSPDGRVT